MTCPDLSVKKTPTLILVVPSFICELQARAELEPIVDCKADLSPDHRLEHIMDFLLVHMQRRPDACKTPTWGSLEEATLPTKDQGTTPV